MLTAQKPILPQAAQLLHLQLRPLLGAGVGAAAAVAAVAVEAAVVAAAEQEHYLGSGTPDSGTVRTAVVAAAAEQEHYPGSGAVCGPAVRRCYSSLNPSVQQGFQTVSVCSTGIDFAKSTLFFVDDSGH